MNNDLTARKRFRSEMVRPPPLRRTLALLAIVIVAMTVILACDRFGDKVVLLVQVGSELVPCEGTESMTCMLVNGEVFHDTIEGFEYEEGFIYRLRVEREDLYPDSEPPPDVSRYRYRLVEMIEKEPSLRQTPESRRRATEASDAGEASPVLQPSKSGM